jgi:hypothetical protein
MENDLIVRLAIWQVVVPLGLIVLNALVPIASLAGVLLRTAAIFGVLFYTARVGLWLFPPWWTPFGFGLLQVLIAWWQMRRLKARGPSPLQNLWRRRPCAL